MSAHTDRPRALFAMTTDYIPESTGGVEATTHALSLALARGGWTTGVLAGSRRGGVFARRSLISRLTGRGRLALDHDLGYPAFRSRRPLKSVAEIVRRFRPDVAVIQLGRIVPLTRAFVDRGVPCVVVFHNLVPEQIGGEPFQHPLVQYATVSRFMAGEIERHYGLHAAVIPPLVDPVLYRTESSREVVTFINPTAFKGLDIALALAHRRPDIRFDFIEAWPLHEDERRVLEAELARLPNVVLRPHVDDMREVYRRSRLLLVPSQSESWCRVVTEAQASGIPAIARKVGGLPESVGGGGVLVEPNDDIAAWDRALASLWDDRATYEDYSRRARERARDPAIQPKIVIDGFAALLDAHAARR
jgi:glycosyltransferase involved in cell wall biosynthesis